MSINASLATDVSKLATQTSVNAIPVSPIKSIQRGTTGPSSSAPFTVTISPVNMSKAVVNRLGSYANSTAALTDNMLHGITLTNSTTLTISQYASGIYNSWEVKEYV